MLKKKQFSMQNNQSGATLKTSIQLVNNNNNNNNINNSGNNNSNNNNNNAASGNKSNEARSQHRASMYSNLSFLFSLLKIGKAKIYLKNFYSKDFNHQFTLFYAFFYDLKCNSRTRLAK